jgi:hypothetical protein
MLNFRTMAFKLGRHMRQDLHTHWAAPRSGRYSGETCYILAAVVAVGA